MQLLELINTYYAGNLQARKILIAHSRRVAGLAVDIAERVGRTAQVDRDFVEQASMLHDIGMIDTDTPKLGCHGVRPYITHGIIGAELLRAEGLPRHALVCERHIGVGLSVEDIEIQGLPLPMRDMCPRSVEEEIVAYADLFFSKTKPGRRTPEMVRASLAHYGQHKVAIFDSWHNRFSN